MAGQDVSFDPSLLTQEEAQSLLDKIEINSNAPSNNACKNWSKKSVKHGYPQMKTLREGSPLPFLWPFYDYFSYIRSYLGAYTKKTSA